MRNGEQLKAQGRGAPDLDIYNRTSLIRFAGDRGKKCIIREDATTDNAFRGALHEIESSSYTRVYFICTYRTVEDSDTPTSRVSPPSLFKAWLIKITFRIDLLLLGNDAVQS